MANSIKNMKNPSFVLYGAGNAKFEDREIPNLEDDHDVLVRIAFVGVCGSDVHFWRHGGVRLIVDSERGIIMGHEASGTVHAIGHKVSKFNIGDRVAIEPGVPCRRCKYCKDGVYNLCVDMKFAAAPPDTPGTLTKFYRIQEDLVYKVPDDISLEEAVLVEPTAVAVHAAKMIDIRPGETVVVMGSGTIGLLCGAVAKQYGAEKVVLVDILEHKLEFARKYLACDTFIPNLKATPEENAANLRSSLNLGRVDTVIEASGAASSIQTGVHVLNPGGKYVQTGLGTPEVTFPITLFSEKELLFRGCFRYGSGDFELATSFIKRKAIDVKPLITSVSPFEEVVMAWEKTAKGEGIKNLIRGVQD